jgi:hypothetical protein
VFTNRGAVGAVTFTLPAAAPALAGVFYEFLGIADQSITVATPGRHAARRRTTSRPTR